MTQETIVGGEALVMNARKIAVIGAGTIGHGVAQLFAQAGIDVFLASRSEATLKQALRRIRANLQLFNEHGLVRKDAIEEILSKISTTTNIEVAVAGADFVVEAVAEKMDLKKELFKRFDSACLPHTILATSTSGLSITEISRVTGRPEKVVGTHFLNQPHIMPIVEVVKGEDTSESTFDCACLLIERIGKVPIRVRRDIPGYLLNRLQHAMWREAISLLSKGVAPPEDIDRVVTMGFGLRLPIVGPLQLMDLAGLDLVLDIHSYLFKDIESSPEPSPLLKEKVRRGELGAKTGKGFYAWSHESHKEALTKLDRHLISYLVNSSLLRKIS